MPSLVKSATAEATLRSCLRADGFSVNKSRLNGETGVDVLAERGKETIHIEVIGFKSSPPSRSIDFFQSFFRAISRIKDGATRCVIALPARWANGLPSRAKQYDNAWMRLGKAFPELEIWLVDTESKSYTVTRWNDWLA